MNETMKWKTHRMVEFIRTNALDLDWMELAHGDWEGALAELGLEPLSKAEALCLRQEILDIAAAQQSGEIARTVWQTLNNPLRHFQVNLPEDVLPEDWPEP